MFLWCSHMSIHVCVCVCLGAGRLKFPTVIFMCQFPFPLKRDRPVKWASENPISGAPCSLLRGDLSGDLSEKAIDPERSGGTCRMPQPEVREGSGQTLGHRGSALALHPSTYLQLYVYTRTFPPRGLEYILVILALLFALEVGAPRTLPGGAGGGGLKTPHPDRSHVA